MQERRQARVLGQVHVPGAGLPAGPHAGSFPPLSHLSQQKASNSEAVTQLEGH